ncbi:signal peptidase I [Glutamicibacter uratoxydans]|uniref:signal peptidase I n=1 Tax=Glutamicibacter uratoxydans TaxID=43667 RepID=UPI003D6FCEB4
MIMVILGYFFNISIMMFRTGSMSPTIEAGSIALVREVPATGLQEGDVVTVDRGPGLLPVTHRVLDVQSIDEQTGVATFTMKGDANATPDPMPYSVDTVREVIFSVPGIAPAIQWFSNPLVLGGLTISASCLVVWAFWPREPKLPANSAHTAVTLGLLPVLLLMPPFGTPTPDDRGQAQIEHIHSEVLQLRSITYPQSMVNMSPGDSAIWVVDIWAEAPESGTIDVTLSAPERLTQDIGPFLISVDSCTLESRAATTRCTTPLSTLLAPVAATELAHDRQGLPLLSFPTEQTRRFVVTSFLPESTGLEHTTKNATIRLAATGSGEKLTVDPYTPHAPESLPKTGVSTWLAVMLSVAIILILCGVKSMRRRRVRHEN